PAGARSEQHFCAPGSWSSHCITNYIGKEIPVMSYAIALKTARHRRRGYRPVVEALEDRRMLSSMTLIEDFQDDANPQLPGFDSSGVFQHTATIEQIVNTPSAPSPPHALEVF